MKKFLLGLVLGLLLLPACGYVYFRLGLVPVATSAPPMPFEKKVARMALHARLKAEAPAKAPFTADEAALTGGAKVYVDHCAFCHGLPRQTDSPSAAKGMFPPPPQLFDKDDMVTDDPAGDTYWKVANGIRLTGMPGFSKSLSTTQMWQVSLLLADADKLPEASRAALAPRIPPPPQPTEPSKK
ncbi:MAG TPA: c-type cytochrome [Candidatus Saccharimonadales bacterium]|nr:c-type cytochrome [Candidatus Saccharimonadales bacterium]